MAGGMRFDVADTVVRDQFGGQVVCTACGGELWDITVGPGAQQSMRCASSDCQQAADPVALMAAAEIGQAIAETPAQLDVQQLLAWLRTRQQSVRETLADTDDFYADEPAGQLKGALQTFGEVIQHITLG